MRTVVVIPVRYASTRFPGKPLARDTGKYLIQHVYERALGARHPERVLVATDDERIQSACRDFGAEVVMTPTDCASGTDRVARAVSSIECDVVVNVQGDEPEIDPAHIDQLTELMANGDAHMATLGYRSLGEQAYRDPNVVKVVMGDNGRALYFTRAAAPYDRSSGGAVPREGFIAHIGVYAYRKQFLSTLTTLPPSPLERLEALEQLRALEAGYSIALSEVAVAAQGIDTPEQYREFVKRYGERCGP
ncbi:3-deoxy-manno-octulosonate cytidylyltransferase [Planctomycetota bacterium]